MSRVGTFLRTVLGVFVFFILFLFILVLSSVSLLETGIRSAFRRARAFLAREAPDDS